MTKLLKSSFFFFLFIYLTEIRQHLTNVIHFRFCSMSTHQLLPTRGVCPHLSIEVSHDNLYIPSRHLLQNCLYLFIEVNLCFLCCFICWGTAMRDSDLPPPRVEPGLNNPRRHWFPIYHDFRLHSFLSIAELLQWPSSTSTGVPSHFTYPQNANTVLPHLLGHLGTLTRLKHCSYIPLPIFTHGLVDSNFIGGLSVILCFASCSNQRRVQWLNQFRFL